MCAGTRGGHIGREEAGQLCAQLEGELRGDAELLSLLAFISLSLSLSLAAVPFYGAAGQVQPSSPAASRRCCWSQRGETLSSAAEPER